MLESTAAMGLKVDRNDNSQPVGPSCDPAGEASDTVMPPDRMHVNKDAGRPRVVQGLSGGSRHTPGAVGTPQCLSQIKRVEKYCIIVSYFVVWH